MNGEDIKKLLIVKDIDMDKHIYFDNKREYNIDEIPIIDIDKNLLKEKLIAKYGKTVSEYIIGQTYKNETENINPKNIINLVKN